ncbi:putative cytochrome p450 oxidoreductase protein [Phaeoacremonium minimum UCRPA7]|uniref:Putative cytochrome p450 oxidoreductase protein n=1 Tax=Phaeoacremonium minimum (strain UCR-PA7) TaxID=1286976 RepID=R8BEZ9_PHAM7|nr:putative cytochrome p450 oxidoreductase protein [Phaeoacremonium minimum UCRPA7]EON97862.1 putative cytochrome p450 oxidoreductase protein [Phaeoacremonium minimum UCRPA7]
MLPFWVVCEIFYGRLPTPLLQELSDLAPLRERIFRYVIQGGIMRFSLSQWLPTQANAELREFQSRWSAFNNAAWAHALEQSPSAPIVQLYEATMRGDMTKDELLQTLDESMYANLDVTTGGLSWNFVFLAAHPDVQKRVCSEVQTAVQENRLHSYLLSESTYLAACVLESSRLKPLAAFSVPQAAPSDREVDGYIIPRGTNYVVDAYALNIQSDTWAPDNAAYRPDRFLGRRNTDLRYRFWRFGFGPRQCMGKYVADLIIRQTMAHLVLNYELGWQKKEDWSRNQESWITHPDFLLRCVKKAV